MHFMMIGRENLQLLLAHPAYERGSARLPADESSHPRPAGRQDAGDPRVGSWKAAFPEVGLESRSRSSFDFCFPLSSRQHFLPRTLALRVGLRSPSRARKGVTEKRG